MQVSILITHHDSNITPGHGAGGAREQGAGPRPGQHCVCGLRGPGARVGQPQPRGGDVHHLQRRAPGHGITRVPGKENAGYCDTLLSE